MDEKAKKTKPRRRTYSGRLKAAVLLSVAALGVVGAAEKHAVPVRTVYGWRRRGAEQGEPGGSGDAGASAGSPEPELSGATTGGGNAAKGRRYGPAERGAILETAAREGVAAAARRHGCATWSIGRWRREAAREAAPRGTGREAQPGEARALTPEQEERQGLVLDLWRTNPGFGPSQIRNQLKRLGYRVSVHTVRDLMTAHGYIQPRVRPKTPERGFEVVRPRQLYHLDFLHLYVHKQRQCLLLIEDDCSRFIAGWALLKSERADGVIETLDAAINRYGKPEGVMVDRGSAFYSFQGVSRFERYVTDANIDYFPIDEARKNGKVEKLNAAVRKELLTKVEFADLDDAVHRIAAWVHSYNYRRTHMALGGLLVPADRFHGMAEDALRRIEEGNGESPLDVLAPAHRGLEIFRVVSVAGETAVYLMGKKILG